MVVDDQVHGEMAAPGAAHHTGLVDPQCVEDGDGIGHVPFHVEGALARRRGQASLLEPDHLVAVAQLGLKRRCVVGKPRAPVQQQKRRARTALPGVDVTTRDGHLVLAEDGHGHSMPDPGQRS